MKYQDAREYSKSKDFFDVIKELNKIQQQVQEDNLLMHPRCKSPIVEHDLTWYFDDYNVPFFDIVFDAIIEIDGISYLKVETFTAQLNTYLKSIFLRRFWDKRDAVKDPFCDLVWNHYKANQVDEQFDKLEKIALTIYNSSDSIGKFTLDFTYNNAFSYYSVADIDDYFEDLVENGVFEYKDYNLVHLGNITDLADKVEARDDETKGTFEGKKEHTLFYRDVYNKMMSCNSKYSFLVNDMEYEDHKTFYQGNYIYHTLEGSQYLVPAWLIFINPYYKETDED